MRVLLISSNVASTPYPTYPLGLGMVASSLVRAGHYVRQFDFLQNGNSTDRVAEEIRLFRPDMIGISIRNIDNVNLLNHKQYLHVVGEIVKTIRNESSAPVVVGGSGFSLMPEAILRSVGADYGIVGEGETAMVEFLSGAENGEYPKERCLYPERRLNGRDIRSACYDAEIMRFYLKNGNVASIQTKRGCTQRCLYCSYPSLEGSAIRSRDPKGVVEDLLYLSREHKAEYIFFTDSLFNDDQEHYLDLIEEMERKNINIPWTAFFKPRGLNGKIVSRMKRTGLQAAELGSDAPSDRMLRRLGKSFTFKDIMECDSLLAEHNVSRAHYFMFGGPGETQATVIEGIDNIKALGKTVSLITMGIRILPGTPLSTIAGKEQFFGSEDELLEPVYYISRAVGREWLEETLHNAFSTVPYSIFPPDAMDESLHFLHRLGYAGAMYEMLLQGKGPSGVARLGQRI